MRGRAGKRLALVATGAWLAVCALAPGVAVAQSASSTSLSAMSQSDPTIGHRYRHGVERRRALTAFPATTTSHNMVFGGGQSAAGYTSPVGVTTGAPKVYLVYWGSQWGSQSTDANGYAHLSGDPSGIAPIQQAFFSGLGTGGETWSGVMTQYCDDAALGSMSCAGSSSRVGYPTGGALAGVWEDAAVPAPAAATGHAIAAEAVAAAAHFANLDGTANRNAQYVIVSPTGTNPDGWRDPRSGFCAWHDDTADTTLIGGAADSPYGTLAFTNMPYLPDAGASCGAGFVNLPGLDDGVTIIGGHEYAETLTDQFPGGGWADASGAENADKCAWLVSGAGASADITLTTGTFPVQGTWSNDAAFGRGACAISHPIGVSVGPAFKTIAAATFTSTTHQSFVVKASGGSGTTMTESGALPPGVTFTAKPGAAILAGTVPSGSEGTYPLVITASNLVAATNQAFTLVVTPTRMFTSPGTVTFTSGLAKVFTVAARGNFAKNTTGPPLVPAVSETGPLPAGLTFTDNGDGTANLAGTTTATGTYTLTITASNVRALKQVLKITVN